MSFRTWRVIICLGVAPAGGTEHNKLRRIAGVTGKLRLDGPGNSLAAPLTTPRRSGNSVGDGTQ